MGLTLAPNDKMNGDSGAVILVAGLGNDKVNGGSGRDLLIGGEGKDDLKGGSDEAPNRRALEFRAFTLLAWFTIRRLHDQPLSVFSSRSVGGAVPSLTFGDRVEACAEKSR